MTERMWRVTALFRVVTLAYAAVLILRDYPRYAHPAGGLVALGIMIGWTALATTAYARPAGRTRWMIAADVAVAVALVLSTRWIDSPARISAGMPTIPAFWAASPVLACAVAGGPWAGIAGALVISAADLAERPQMSLQNPFSNIVLLLIAGGIGGYIVRLGVQAERAVERVARTEAAIAERDRLARSIHDSVLQVLALVSSRGRALGGEAAELGELAAEQETALRRLVTSSAPGLLAAAADGNGAASPAGASLTGASLTGASLTDAGLAGASLTGAGPAGAGLTGAGLTRGTDLTAATSTADLREVIEKLAGARVTVSCPATAVLLPAAAAEALRGATAAALDNVRRHAGDAARAWVLVEDEDRVVRVSVRDDGPGFADGRLAQAAAAGRLGVSQSIIGRIRAAGGTAHVTSAPGQGTEVDLALPRP
jgi:signal transduction histidine kinase